MVRMSGDKPPEDTTHERKVGVQAGDVHYTVCGCGRWTGDGPVECCGMLFYSKDLSSLTQLQRKFNETLGE